MWLHLLLLRKKRKSVQELRKPHIIRGGALTDVFSVGCSYFDLLIADFKSAASASFAIPALIPTLRKRGRLRTRFGAPSIGGVRADQSSFSVAQPPKCCQPVAPRLKSCVVR